MKPNVDQPTKADSHERHNLAQEIRVCSATLGEEAKMKTETIKASYGEYGVHPFADQFPLIEGREFDDLVADIKNHGQREPIMLDGERRIVDGRNRFRACMAAGVTPIVATLSDKDDEVVSYILSMNIHRRHLTLEQKRDLIGRALVRTPAVSDRKLAQAIKVDHKTVAAVRRNKESSGEIPQLKKRMGKDGRVRATKAEPILPRATAKASGHQPVPRSNPQPQPAEPVGPASFEIKKAVEALLVPLQPENRKNLLFDLHIKHAAAVLEKKHLKTHCTRFVRELNAAMAGAR
jgi:hypothetical protein